MTFHGKIFSASKMLELKDGISNFSWQHNQALKDQDDLDMAHMKIW